MNAAMILDSFKIDMMHGMPFAVLHHPHPALREVCSHVPDSLFLSPELHCLSATMRTLLTSTEGVAMAANQINYPVCMFVIKKSLADKANLDHTLINPVWTGIGERYDVKEGCLSFGNRVILKGRYQAVEVIYTNLKGRRIRKTVQNLVAQIIQHECDHLSGRVMTDD